MNIAVGSAFRNSAGAHLSRYIHQLDRFRVEALARGHHVRWIAAEGDSVDNTRMEILRFARQLPIELHITVRAHGGPVFGSTEGADRMKALSYVGNGILENVGPDVDALVYIESDLVWKPGTMLRLIDKLEGDVDVVSPLIFAGEAFYDIWAFRKGGERFGPFAPFHPELHPTELTEVESAGSCLVMRGEVARTCRIVDDMALVGFCRDARAKGYNIYVDPTERIEHP